MKLGDDLTERSPSSFRGLQKDRPTSSSFWEKLKHGYVIWRASDSCISRPLINSLRSQQKYQTKPKLNQAFNYIFWTNHHGIYAKFPCSTCFQAKPRCYRRWLVRLGRLREPRKRDRVWRWLCPFGTQPFPIGSRRAPMGRWSTDPWMDGWFLYISKCRNNVRIPSKKPMDPVMLALPSLFSKKMWITKFYGVE